MSTYNTGELQAPINLGNRDAMHVAVVVARVNTYMNPGQMVCFTDDKNVRVEYLSSDAHGYIDPWLPHGPKVGDCVLVFVKPSLVGKLTHQFELNLSDGYAPVDTYDECGRCFSEPPYPDYPDDDNSCRGCT